MTEQPPPPPPEQPPPPPEQPPPAEQPAGGAPPEARNWALFAHLAAFAGVVIPFGNIIGPLVIWLIKREEHPFIDSSGKEALNFNISFAIYAIASFILMLLLIGFLLIVIVVVAWLVLVIMAAVKTSNGELYRYPLTIRLVS